MLDQTQQIKQGDGPYWSLAGMQAFGCTYTIVSIAVPFWGLPFRILSIDLVKPKKELQWRL